MESNRYFHRNFVFLTKPLAEPSFTRLVAELGMLNIEKQPITQSKAPTAKRPKKKKIPSSTQLDVLKSSRIVKSSSTQATHLQPAKEFMVIADATKGLDAFESAEVQGNQPETADATKVLDQNIIEEKDVGVCSLEEPTFEQLMDEVDKQSKAAQEEPESPYDTESEIKIVKSFKSSWSIHPEIDQTNDANITFIGSGPINMELDGTCDDLHSMPSDDLTSLTGFETPDSSDKEFNSATKEHLADNLNATSDGDIALPNASAGVLALSDPLGHLRRELTTISSKVDQLESCITKNVFEELKSFMHTLVSDALKEILPGLLADALKASLPSLIQEFVQNTIQQSMGEQTLVFQAQIHQTLEEQLDSLIYKPMNNLSGKGYAQGCNRSIISSPLSKMPLLTTPSESTTCGQREHSITQDNTETTLTVHQPEKEKDLEDEPPTKKLRVLIPTPDIPKPIPLSSIILEHLLKPLEQKLSVEQFTNQLFSTTSSSFASSPPREPTPLRDPSKVKGVATEEPMKELILYIEEGGSILNMLKMKSFVTPEGVLSQEDLMAQLKEMKRLADLKAKKEESEKVLMKLMNPATVKAQTLKLAEYEEKRGKMLDEYNECIYKRDNLLPITKMHDCGVNSSHEATMRITRNHDPLNVTVYVEFRLKTLGFSKWLEEKKLGVPLLPELTHFRKPVEDMKRKRTEILKEVFEKENIVVDGMHKNLIPPLGVVGSREFNLATTAQLIKQQSAIQRGTPEVEEIIKKLVLTIEARDDILQARKIVQDNLDGLGQDM
ncbi:hypothetical protein Tco_0951182 [Tanacetum coccineum]|uniref:Uncharacterized protein n=1 Tax=Tanacetum coccineum TaxID=301880 RepID=A0ABQ5DVS4_9ASTR